MASPNNQLAIWEEIRKKGCFRFVLLQGGLRWGGAGTAILYTIITWFIARGPT